MTCIFYFRHLHHCAIIIQKNFRAHIDRAIYRELVQVDIFICITMIQYYIFSENQSIQIQTTNWTYCMTKEMLNKNSTQNVKKPNTIYFVLYESIEKSAEKYFLQVLLGSQTITSRSPEAESSLHMRFVFDSIGDTVPPILSLNIKEKHRKNLYLKF